LGSEGAPSIFSIQLFVSLAVASSWPCVIENKTRDPEPSGAGIETPVVLLEKAPVAAIPARIFPISKSCALAGFDIYISVQINDKMSQAHTTHAGRKKNFENHDL
jgi:hypothetical protein